MTKPIHKLGIITIATGKYFEEFIPSLKVSIDQYFNFKGYEVHFYCFTDSSLQVSGVQNIAIPHLGWPFSTLLRYFWIQQSLELLQVNDFLLYMDADMKVVSTPPESIFEKNLIAVRHPGYINSPGAFELDRQDSCYIPPPLRKVYFQGCFWGGKTTQFSDLIKTLSRMVDDDLSLGNIPIWHDESYLNKYFSIHECVALPPLFAWPEGNIFSQTPYVLHLEKKHHVIRQSPVNRLNINSVFTSGNVEQELEIYKKLYLNSHEKCQRLESRLAQKLISLNKLREWLSFYRGKFF